MKNGPACWGTGAELDHKELGESVRSRRVGAGISLGQAARRIGISESYLSYLETGKRRWSREAYEKAMSL